MAKVKEVPKQKTPYEIKRELTAQINKNYDYEVILEDNNDAILQKIPTGVFSFDVESGGGVPRGRATILVGEESTMKSTLMYIFAGKTQRVCGTCMIGNIVEKKHTRVKVEFNKKSNKYVEYKKDSEGNYRYFSKCFFSNSAHQNMFCPGEKVIPLKTFMYLYQYEIECTHCEEGDYSLFGLVDAEHNYTADWGRRFGVINSYMILAQTEYSEQSGDLLREWMNSGRVGCIGVDSVDALGALIEDGASMEDQQMGVQARVWNKITRAIHSKLNKPTTYRYTPKGTSKRIEKKKRAEPVIIIISQYREKIGGYGNPLVEGGGKGKKYLSSLTVELRKGEKDWEVINDKKVYMKWQKFSFEFKKSKIIAPHRIGSIHLDFEDLEVKNNVAIFEYALRYGLVEKSGAWYKYGENNIQGKDAFAEYLDENPKVQEKMKQKILSLVVT